MATFRRLLYRLNTCILPDLYPFRILKDFTANLTGKTIFSTDNLVRAFSQLPVTKENVDKTATMLPSFRIPAYHVRGVTKTTPLYIPHIDDILIASKEHRRHLRSFFQRLTKYGVVINTAKCRFGQTGVDILGHRISAKGILPLPSKIDTIVNFPRPTTI